MKIEINGEIKEFEEGISLKKLIEQTVKNSKGTAVAVNNSVVSKPEWETFLLKENDKVLIIKATQGG